MKYMKKRVSSFKSLDTLNLFYNQDHILENAYSKKFFFSVLYYKVKINCSSSIADPYLFEGASRHHAHQSNLLFANYKVQFFILRNPRGRFSTNSFLFYGRMFVFYSLHFSSTSVTTRIRLQSLCPASNKKLFWLN